VSAPPPVVGRKGLGAGESWLVAAEFVRNGIKMAELIAAELGLSLVGHLASNRTGVSGSKVFTSHFKALTDPSYEVVELQELIAVLQRVMPRVAEENTTLADAINFHIYLASQTIRAYKMKTPRVRFLNLASFQKKIADHVSLLEDDIARVEDSLGSQVDLGQIKVKVKGLLRSKKAREKKIQGVLKKLERAVAKNDGAQAESLYVQLSNLIGTDAANSETIRPHVAEFLRNLKSTSFRLNIMQPWEETGPEMLGVLGVSRVHLLTEFTMTCNFDSAPPKYTLALNKDADKIAVKYLVGNAYGTASGCLSDIAEVTVDDFTRNLLWIPKSAKYFCFAYPADELNRKAEIADLAPIHLFLMHGGYLYFDEKKTFVQGNCFVSDQNSNPFLCFDGPKKLPEDVAKELHDTDRWHDVTEREILGAGARRFCWLLPAESIAGNDGAEWRHGAFAYWYGDDKPEKANFYTVASMGEVFGVSDSRFAKEGPEAIDALSFGAVDESEDFFRTCCFG